MLISFQLYTLLAATAIRVSFISGFSPNDRSNITRTASPFGVEFFAPLAGACLGRFLNRFKGMRALSNGLNDSVLSNPDTVANYSVRHFVFLLSMIFDREPVPGAVKPV